MEMRIFVRLVAAIATIPVLLNAAFFLFGAKSSSAGSDTQKVTQAQEEHLRTKYGLEPPLPQAPFTFGNWGYSLKR